MPLQELMSLEDKRIKRGRSFGGASSLRRGGLLEVGRRLVADLFNRVVYEYR